MTMVRIGVAARRPNSLTVAAILTDTQTYTNLLQILLNNYRYLIYSLNVPK
jgi:hypothetical protein